MGRGEHKERVNEGEYGKCVLNSHMKMNERMKNESC
jgi:hypothetical protein